MKDFFDFLQTKKYLVLFSTLLIVVIYGYRLLNPTIGIDTEMALADYGASLNWFVGCGRFFCAILRKVIMPYHYNYYLAYILAITFLSATMLVLLYDFEKYGLSDTVSSILFSSLFFSFPTFAEMFYFANQADLISIGFLLATLGAVFVCNHVFFNHQVYYLFIGIILASLSIGCYQAFVYLFIAEILVFYILKVHFSEETEPFRKYLSYAAKLIFAILFALFIYFTANSVITRLFYDPNREYAGYTNASNYISSSVTWTKDSIMQCIANIIKYFLETLQIDNPFGSFIFAAVFITNLFLIISTGIKKKNVKSIYIFLLFIALGITPYLGAVVKGQGIHLREQFILPFVFAFSVAYLYLALKQKHILKVLFVVAMIYISWCQTSTTLELFHTDYLRYRFDYTTIQQITQTAIEKYGSLDDKVLVYSGAETWTIPENQPYGDCIGYSILQWDAHKEWGPNYRINYFSKCLGLTTNIPSMEQIQYSHQFIDNLIPWPSSDSMMLQGNIIIIKLSE